MCLQQFVSTEEYDYGNENDDNIERFDRNIIKFDANGMDLNNRSPDVKLEKNILFSLQENENNLLASESTTELKQIEANINEIDDDIQITTPLFKTTTKITNDFDDIENCDAEEMEYSYNTNIGVNYF